MATALQLITRSMRLATVLSKGETLDTDEAQDGLTALNSMLTSWETERLYVYQVREETFTWAANQQERTVGAAGDFVTTRPMKVTDNCTFLLNNVTYPVQLIDVDAWAAIPDKTTTSTFPSYLYPEYGTALVTLHAWPIPSASITFLLRSWRRLQTFATLTDVLDLPPGMERAIVYSFAEEYGPEFGVAIQPTVQRIAASARRNIKTINSPSPIMKSEVGYMTRDRWSNIYGDT